MSEWYCAEMQILSYEFASYRVDFEVEIGT